MRADVYDGCDFHKSRHFGVKTISREDISSTLGPISIDFRELAFKGELSFTVLFIDRLLFSEHRGN